MNRPPSLSPLRGEMSRRDRLEELRSRGGERAWHRDATVDDLPRRGAGSVHPLPASPLCFAAFQVKGEGLKILSGIQNLLDSFEDAGEVGAHFVVPETQGLEAVVEHVGVSFPVRIAVQVLAAVKFDDEGAFVADEVRDVPAHGFLSAEGDAELSAAQVLPQQDFFGGHASAQHAGDVGGWTGARVMWGHAAV